MRHPRAGALGATAGDVPGVHALPGTRAPRATTQKRLVENRALLDSMDLEADGARARSLIATPRPARETRPRLRQRSFLMRIGVAQRRSSGLAAALCAAVGLAAQQPAPTPGTTPPPADGAGRGAAGRALARGRPGRARSRPRAVGERVHRLPRLAGARLGDRPEHHPHEDGQLRPLRADRPAACSARSSRPGHPTQSGKPSA